MAASPAGTAPTGAPGRAAVAGTEPDERPARAARTLIHAVAAALSIACQATTAPLAWWRFRTFPRYFLLTNLLALPLTSLVMGAAALSIFAAPFGWYPAILTKATDALVHGLVWVLTVISGM